MICDICKEDIYPGEKYYEMPDGLTVCDFDFDCLQAWAKDYRRTMQPDPIEALVIRI